MSSNKNIFFNVNTVFFVALEKEKQGIRFSVKYWFIQEVDKHNAKCTREHQQLLIKLAAYWVGDAFVKYDVH